MAVAVVVAWTMQNKDSDVTTALQLNRIFHRLPHNNTTTNYGYHDIATHGSGLTPIQWQWFAVSSENDDSPPMNLCLRFCN